jgi:outer membrane receptor protein involved in Fe transport
MKKILLNLVILLAPVFLFAQSFISGIVIDGEFQEPLPFANIIVLENNDGTTTDFDGKYSIELSPGVYTLSFSFVGYKTIEITDIKLEEGQIQEVDVILEGLSQQMDEVVVTSSSLRNTEQSVLSVQKKSANLLDGISSQSFKKIGASDLANAVKSIPGVSVQGGKYVYVRGLGDRYTKSILNGMDIPGLDPDRNTIQFDIFPTNVIDQVIVLKSATADLPSDFTGGVVDIITKNIPSKKTFSFSFSSSYNPDMNGINDFLSIPKSSTDWLGYDDGLRKLPVARNITFPFPAQGDSRLTDLTKKFNPAMQTIPMQSGLNYSANLSFGNQFSFGKYELGFISSLSYQKEYNHYTNYQSNRYRKESSDQFELRDVEVLSGPLSVQSVFPSALLGIGFKSPRSRYQAQVMHLQNGTSNAAVYQSKVTYGSENEQKRDVLEYNQRSVTNFLFSGKHYFFDGGLEAEWKVSPTFNKNKDKDIRYSPFRTDDGGFVIEPSETGDPMRIWRDLDEMSVVNKIDVTYNYEVNQKRAKLKTGWFNSAKERDFFIESFTVNFRGAIPEVNQTGNPDLFLLPQNIWDTEDNRGSYIKSTSGEVDQYSSSQYIYAAYISNEMSLSEKLRFVLGVRYELYRQKFTGVDQNKNSLKNQSIIDESNFFPSTNFIYSLNEQTNFRLSYSRTIARPSFKEASNVTIYDPITNTIFLGNLNLKPSYVNNFDLRYERFGNLGNMFAASVFLKNIKDPLEVVIYDAASSNNYTTRNIEQATVLGFEIELRKKLTEQFFLRANTSIIESRQQMDKSPSGEYESKVLNARDGETVEEFRALQGQSPFLINATAEYKSKDGLLNANLSYNVQGRALERVGLGSIPDVFTMPFNNLNFNLERKFGANKKHSATLRVRNILGDTRRSEFISFGAKEKYYFSKRDIGRSISLGYSFKL